MDDDGSDVLRPMLAAPQTFPTPEAGSMFRSIARSALVLGTLTATSLVAAAPAQAGTEARVSGACTGGSTYELRATPSGGAIRIGFRVNTPFTDRFWTTTVTDNGTTV